MMGAVARQKLFLIDTFGFIFRAYHARARTGAPPMRTSTGFSTEAVYIFNNMLRKLSKQHDPPYVAAIFESGEATHRVQEFAEYKANRTETPPDLLDQIPFVRRVLEAMRIPILEFSGFEADDVIGTISRRAEALGLDVVIVSSDKDMLQLVTEHVSMLNPAKDDKIYDPEEVKTFMGVPPEQIADLLALMGDSVDNIPGAPGIGDKGARQILEKFGSIEAALERAAEVERKAYRESLQNNVERIRMSKRLATISTDVPIEFSLDAVKAQTPDPALLKAIYKEMEFHSLLKELGPSEDTRERRYNVIGSADELREWLAGAAGAPVAVAIAKSTEGEFALDMVAADTIGLARRPGEACAVTSELIVELKPWLEDAAAVKVACDVKSAVLQLARLGIEARGFDHDVMIYGFLLDADPGGCGLENQAHRRLDLKLGSAAEQHADITLELYQQLAPAIDGRGLRKLYDEIELPLTRVLARMERTGIRIDGTELKRLSVLMESQISGLTAEIHALAGKPFNISSPQQLGKVLFEDLNLPAPVKYGKGKTISTAADVLDELAAEHEIVRKVLEYRQLTKLKGTYVDALPALIDPATGRLHTSFNQAGAATGRLSSSNPELAEHSDPYRAGARDPRGVRAAGRMEAAGGRLLADRTAPPGAHVRRRTAGAGVPRRRGHPHANGRGGDGGAANDGDSGSAARCQGGELRHRVRHQRVRARGAARHWARGGGAVHQELFRAVRRGEAVHRRDDRGGAKDGSDEDAVRAGAADSGDQRAQSECPWIRGADRRQLAATGHGSGSDQAGDGADRRGAYGGWFSIGDAAAGARRTGVRVSAGGTR